MSHSRVPNHLLKMAIKALERQQRLAFERGDKDTAGRISRSIIELRRLQGES